MDELTMLIIGAILNCISLAIGAYIGMSMGSKRTVSIALDEIEKRSKKSPTAQRALKAMEMLDKVFGDDQAIEQVTRFFREAGDLVSSPEAKNFFKNITGIMRGLSGESKVKLKLPKKKGV